MLAEGQGSVMGILRKIKRWFVRDDGVAAIEFAMIAPPFFMLLTGTLEMSLAFTAGFMLEAGTVEAARLVRTGEAVGSGAPETAFRDRLCEQVSFLIPCASVQYESIVLNGFADAGNFAPQFDANGDLISQGFNAGASDQTVLVRTYYRYQLLTPMIGSLVLPGGQSGSLRLMSTAVIKNEPYTF